MKNAYWVIDAAIVAATPIERKNERTFARPDLLRGNDEESA